LYGIDDTVYAVAQGPVSVGGFNADAGGASARQNHVTVGRIPQGAYVEREIPSTITDGHRFLLLLKRPDFGTARNIKNAINAHVSESVASAFGAGTVSVTIPGASQGDLVEFIAQVQDIEVLSDAQASRVVINERTGTIVVGGNVRIRPCQVAHGGLTITVASTPVISQPLPFSRGETVESEITDVAVEEVEAHLMPVEGASASEVAEGLNRLKVTPRDMIAIFQALREAGVMDADLEIM
jgi:flagellar P-ring protein precursor FlgI